MPPEGVTETKSRHNQRASLTDASHWEFFFVLAAVDDVLFRPPSSWSSYLSFTPSLPLFLGKAAGCEETREGCTHTSGGAAMAFDGVASTGWNGCCSGCVLNKEGAKDDAARAHTSNKTQKGGGGHTLLRSSFIIFFSFPLPKATTHQPPHE
jgi:hypothetical protein